MKKKMEHDEGREMAVEMLIDMHESGPSYRVGKIINESPEASLSARPIQTTKGMLLEKATSLSKYELKGDYLLDIPLRFSKDEEKSDPTKGADVQDGFSTPLKSSSMREEEAMAMEEGASAGDRHKNTNANRALIMRHHSKIILAKQTAYRASIGSSSSEAVVGSGSNIGVVDSNVSTNTMSTSHIDATATEAAIKNEASGSINTGAGSGTVTVAFPPPQLVSSLRKIYGRSNSMERMIEEEVSSSFTSANNANVNVLPGLLRSVFEHPMFDSSSSSTSKSEVTEQVGTIHQHGHGHDLHHSHAHAHATSSVANIETIVGNACWNGSVGDHGHGHSFDGHDDFRGKLIAAFSVLSTSLLPTSTHHTAQTSKRAEDDEDGKMESDVVVGGDDDDLIHELQVSGPLSLLLEEMKGKGDKNMDDMLTSLGLSGLSENLLLDQELMDYYQKASAIYEERIELQKARLIPERGSDDSEKKKLDGESMSTPSTDKKDKEKKDIIHRNSSDPPELEDIPDSPVSGPDDDSDSSDSDDDEEEESVAFSDDEDSSSEEEEDSMDENEEDENNNGEREWGTNGPSNTEERASLLENQDRDSSSSSSSSSQVDEDEDYREHVVGESHDDEAYMLEQALALSLAELNSAVSNNSNANDSVIVTESVVVRDDEEFNNPASSPYAEDVVKSPLDDEEINKKSDHDGLPSLPSPPASSKTEDLREDNNFNPSSFFHFGRIPAQKVLISLLMSVLRKLELRRYQASKDSSELNGNRNVSKRDQLKALLEELTPAASGSRRKSDEWHLTNDDLHLIIALLNILSNARSETIHSLSGEIQASDNSKCASSEDEVPLDDEDDCNTDDPAFAVVGGEKHVASSVAASESLEVKGMVRKAAAAAQIAAVRREKAQERINHLLELLQVLSLSSYILLRCLRLFFQIHDSDDLATPVISQQGVMHPVARLRLSTSLNHFTSSTVAMKCHDLLGKIEEAMERRAAVRDALSSQKLFLEACSLWGECSPRMTSSHELFEQQVIRMLDCTFPEMRDNNITLDQDAHRRKVIKGSVEFPWSDHDENLLKLDSLCRRIRSSDILDRFLPRPCTGMSDWVSGLPCLPSSPSKLMSSLGKIVFKGFGCLDASIARNINACFYVLCHRLNSNILLWDGFSQLSTESFSTDGYNGGSESHSSDNKPGQTLSLVKDPTLVFDSGKCADSIAIARQASSNLVGSNCVNQRANKSWGTVLSSKYFEPKSGVHRWAVRMDKCERGHIFLGVATSRASTKTYVGGDKHGWGVIGTQALWHDKRKIRSDYGKTFRTGETIVVTLDTDAGTLAFSVWNEEGNLGSDIATSVEELDFEPGFFDDMSGQGFLEDWGVAFEGLPVDVRLYPAVGLYQRDDKATLIGVSSTEENSDSGSYRQSLKGRSFFPPSEELDCVRQWNSALCDEGIFHSITVLKYAIESMSNGEERSIEEKEHLFQNILPSTVSCLGLFPSMIPTLSGKVAYTLIPIILKCLSCIEKKIDEESRRLSPFSCMRTGKWTIRAASSSPASVTPMTCRKADTEYSVEVDSLRDPNTCTLSFTGSGSGTKNASASERVNINGSCRGNLMYFAEVWPDRDESASCAVEARVNFDGTKFEGRYVNEKDGTSGFISGAHNDSVQVDAFETQSESVQKQLVQCSYLLTLAASHLALILDRGAPLPDTNDERIEQALLIPVERINDLSELCSSYSITSKGLVISNQDTQECISHIQKSFTTSFRDIDPVLDEYVCSWYYEATTLLLETEKNKQKKRLSSINFEVIDDVDSIISSKAGGIGSLSSLDADSYQKARKSIIAALLYHCGQGSSLTQVNDSKINRDLLKIWRTALQIVEAGVRSAIMEPSVGTTRAEACHTYCVLVQAISDLLLDMSPAEGQLSRVLGESKRIYSVISSEEEVKYMRCRMGLSSRKGVLRLIALSTMSQSLTSDIHSYAAIEVLVSTFQCLCRKSHARMKKSTIDFGNVLHGVGSFAQDVASDLTMNIFQQISTFTRNLLEDTKLKANRSSFPTTQSIFFTILTCYLSPLEGFIDTFEEGHIWELISFLFSSSGKYLNVPASKRIEKGKDTMQHFTKESNHFSSLDVTNRNLLQAAINSLHSILFQLQRSRRPRVQVEELFQRPLSLLRAEILNISCYLAEHDKVVVKRMKFDVAVSEFKHWNSVNKNPLGIKQDNEKRRHKPIATKSINFQSLRKFKLQSLQHYLSELLNITFSVFRIHTFVPNQVSLEYSKDLLGFIGNPSQAGCTGEPGIARSSNLRILRLLRIILPQSEPNEGILETLLSHIRLNGESPYFGKKCKRKSQYSQVYLEAKELVSLIRYLYSCPTDEDSNRNTWQDVITAVMEKMINGDESSRKQVQSVLGGLPSSAVPGAFVMIKPDAAKVLSTQSKGSSDARSPNGASAIVDGGGLESIVYGLCRKQAKAGIISNIDEASATCEVVLIDREDPLMKGSKTTPVAVRAMRVPCSDVTPVDEIPFLFKRSSPLAKPYREGLGRDLSLALSEFMSASGNVERIDLLDVATSLRSNIYILSNPSFFEQFVQDGNEEVTNYLSTVMALSSITSLNENLPAANSACSQNLRNLSDLESRYWYLKSLQDDVVTRKSTMIIPPEDLFKLKQALGIPDKNDENHEDGNEVQRSQDSSSRSSGTNQAAETPRVENAVDSTIHASDEEDEDEDEDDAEDSVRSAEDEELAHLREAAIVQMAELGLPRSWSEFALRRVGGTNIEAAVHFCLERGADMERLIAEERERSRLSSSNRGVRRRSTQGSASGQFLQQLVEMGFPSHWCAEALAATGQNVDEALTWILTNGERLSALDEGDDDDDEEDDDSSDGEDDELDESKSVCKESIPKSTEKDSDTSWPDNIVCPLRSISGRANINAKTLEVTGLPAGGFSSIGTKGVLLTSGKWYYECILISAGCIQIGWADSSFAGHCHADRGDGCGDGPSSWAYDGWRRYRWHSNATEFGCRWQEGDVIGCLLDMDQKEVRFTLNGKSEEIGMGLAFSGDGFSPCGGVYACVSFNRREKIRLVLGGGEDHSFHFPPPAGYKAVGEAVLAAVDERSALIGRESALTTKEAPPGRKQYLCNFSDGEHGHEIFAWQHRYYGSDASVHLGVGRRGRNTSMNKDRRSLLYRKGDEKKSSIDLFLSSLWKEKNPKSSHSGSSPKEIQEALEYVRNSYDTTLEDIQEELRDTLLALCILYSKKLVLHVAVGMSSSFQLEWFCTPRNNCLFVARQFLTLVETCCSLHAEGWVGEAGAMSMASEALGLAISSNERSLQRGTLSSLLAGNRISDNERKTNFDNIFGSMTHILNAVVCTNPERKSSDVVDPSDSFASCAEAVLGGEGGCSIMFLRHALRNALLSSDSMADVFIAYIRCAVRNLSAIEYHSNDSNAAENENDDEDTESLNNTSHEASNENRAPDARLISFLTGVLLSLFFDDERKFTEDMVFSLCESWSAGLYSASMPWRMICAMTLSSILNMFSTSKEKICSKSTLFANYLVRLNSIIARRIWAERAAAPIYSRYLQSLIELQSSVNSASSLDKKTYDMEATRVDAATPLSLFDLNDSDKENLMDSNTSWEEREGWICSDKGWEVWTGAMEYFEVDWTPPARSAVRSLMDGGEGPPMLRVGCAVLRGLDWDEEKLGDDDGKKCFEAKKVEREEAKKEQEESEPVPSSPQDEPSDKECDATKEVEPVMTEADEPVADSSMIESPSKKKKKIPLPKLPIGRVTGIEAWNGIPGVARRVKWDLTGKEEVYRYGGDGGRYDIVHVEVNDKSTRVIKRHPHSETSEQCASRHGFGSNRIYNIILRIRPTEVRLENVDGETERICEGILEFPDFGAGVVATCRFHEDGAMTLTERRLIYGSKDSGWEARFGQPSYVPGTTIVLSPTNTVSSSILKEDGISDKFSDDCCQFEELLGSTSFPVKNLRNRADGKKLRVASEMRLVRGKSSKKDSSQSSNTVLPPLSFDSDYHSSFLSLSRDGRTVTCTSAEGRGSAFFATGFSKGIHYFEVKIEQADVGSVYIGVAEKPKGTSGNNGIFDSHPRLKGWYGCGFVNFRATYNEGSERIYGSHCHAGDSIGVLLDCDAGRLSYFFDGVKYGEHILNDLGCAFENISPFGFNADGCGGGGAGQGSPSGEGGRGGRYPANGCVRPKALWPVIGLRHPGDRVTISRKWMTSYGIDGSTMLRNSMLVDEILCNYHSKKSISNEKVLRPERELIPEWMVKESFAELKKWQSGKFVRTVTRSSLPMDLSSAGMDIDVDTSPFECAVACASIGLPFVLLPGDIVSVKRSAGRILELSEEAEILGAFQRRLWYKLVSQKSEGGSLTEGGGRAWFWDESEIVDGGLQLISPSSANEIELPVLDRFKCTSKGGIRITYSSGAVMRSDIEILEEISTNLGVVPVGTTIPPEDIIERRVNSCGVVRFLVEYEPVGRGWISLRIRGGEEETIFELLESSDNSDGGTESQANASRSFFCPYECASVWISEYHNTFTVDSAIPCTKFCIDDYEIFNKALNEGMIKGLSPLESDTILCDVVTAISDHSASGNALDCPYKFLYPVLYHALSAHDLLHADDQRCDVVMMGSSAALEAAASKVANISTVFPPMKALLARISMLRAFNRRAKFALPLFSLRPSQEDSAVLGGLAGFGASVERLGKTRETISLRQWVQAPCIGERVRTCKKLFFTSVKRALFNGITEATTTATSLSQDEYELPRDIRTVRVNRLKARKGMSATDKNIRRKKSVFGQLQNELSGWSGAALRRGFIAKGHGGQKRAFKVKLIGEGVNDYSGPYREIFTDAIREINEWTTSSESTLGILDPSPNAVVGVGENRDLKVFASCESAWDAFEVDVSDPFISEEERTIWDHFSSHLVPRNEEVRDLEDSLSFLGKLVSTAVRHGIPVDLDLPLGTVWRRLCEEKTSTFEILEEVDLIAHHQSKVSPTGMGQDPSVLKFLATQQHLFNAFADGVSSVLPVELFSMFTGVELRDYFCGNQEIDVELLRTVVEYEGYKEDDKVIQFFWEVIREMSTADKKLFLQFVWARSRLPLKESDFDAPFKIQKDTKTSCNEALPSASTCFFSLSLPQYESMEMLKEKLLFAIKNVKTMETDFSTNDVEIEEGWRGL